MWNPISTEMPRFWPPRANGFWRVALSPLRRYYLRRFYGILDITIHGGEHLRNIPAGDGVLIAPNHSHDSDPHVMIEVGRRMGRQFYFMAAWQIFKMHWGIDGFVMQRMGAFSVDREGCDRRAVRQAVELLATGRPLVVFPEGEVYRLNGRLTPLLEGVAFMALTAQREIGKREGQEVQRKSYQSPVASLQQMPLETGDRRLVTPRRVWVLPTAIKYQYADDVLPALEAAMGKLEAHLLLKQQTDAPLPQRIMRLGDVLLTIKEKEKLGHSREGELQPRIHDLIEHLLSKQETAHLKKCPSAETVPLRVKAVRRRMLEIYTDEKAPAEARKEAQDALDDVQLALQLYCYPGDYVLEQPSIERMAETIEKFEEDVEGFTPTPKGKRRAQVTFGEPIDLQRFATSRHGAAEQVTEELEKRIEQLMRGS
ncbi:MAG TPA: lysophospholipid acyltransferase family protein [Tepidisphaeraceae bacterium]|jgi:1-acyl-sn-glycerol-3-phosphate acyltransferase